MDINKNFLRDRVVRPWTCLERFGIRIPRGFQGIPGCGTQCQGGDRTQLGVDDPGGIFPPQGFSDIQGESPAYPGLPNSCRMHVKWDVLGPGFLSFPKIRFPLLYSGAHPQSRRNAALSTLSWESELIFSLMLYPQKPIKYPRASPRLENKPPNNNSSLFSLWLGQGRDINFALRVVYIGNVRSSI